MRTYSLLFSALLLLTGWACKTKQAASEPGFSDSQAVIFLDSAAASKTVVVDQSEGFFESISRLDMEIQMKQNYEENVGREEILKDYKTYLQEDVQSFSAAEKEGLTKVFKNALDLCQKLNSNIFPKELKLIKSKGKPYGLSTFYTRDNSIVIPAGLLEASNIPLLLDVALHEIFHIYSRYNKTKKDELYALIGYKPVDKTLLDIPKALKDRLLLNPDGINYAYVMTVKNPAGKSIQVIPLIVSKQLKFNAEQPTFFSYLKFDLYEIRAPFVKRIPVVANNDGTSTIDFQQIPDFFSQIRDNTGYIIHPDEVLADNFVLVAQRQAEGSIGDGELSKEGLELLGLVEEILRKP